MAVKLHILALRIMTPSSLLRAYQHFGGIHWLHLQGESKNGVHSQETIAPIHKSTIQWPTETTKLKEKKLHQVEV
jgi:hypothetical protein